MGFNRLLETSHYRLKGLLLVEPMGKKMYAHIRQMRRNLDQCPPAAGRLPRGEGVPCGDCAAMWRATD